MQELRTDELTGTCVIVAPGRATRPVVFSPPAATAASALESCPFCPGHEAMTPPEVARAGAGAPNTPGWEVRVIPNLYPIVGQDDGVPGAHEVLVLSPAHDCQLDALSPDGAVAAVLALRDRAAYQLGAGFVHAQPLLNQGRAAGASIEHPHAQLIAMAFTPPHVDEVLARFVKSGRDLVMDSFNAARGASCALLDADAVSWCPLGSASPYVVRVALRSATARFDRLPDDDIRALTVALRDALARLHRAMGDVAYNVVVNTAPRDDPRPFHCWVDIVPRVGVIGGFEMGTGVLVNPVAPEAAASMLRGA